MKDEEKKLPTLKELEDGELDNYSSTALTVLINQPPYEKWVKKHPMGGFSYIPIDKVEFALTRIYKDWFVEIKWVQLVGNSIEVSVRLWYKPFFDPLKSVMNTDVELQKVYYSRKKTDWYNFQDGTGSAPIQVDKGEKASAFDKIKHDGVMKAAPAAESYAVKDAAEKIGRFFGKDLNRKELTNYDGLLDVKDAQVTEK